MIRIEQKESSPLVEVDPENATVLIKGDSFVSNPHQVYAPLVNWGNSFVVAAHQTLKIDVMLGYYSTSNIQLLNVFFRTLNRNNPGKINLTYHLNEEEEEDLEETILSLMFNTGIECKRVYI